MAGLDIPSLPSIHPSLRYTGYSGTAIRYRDSLFLANWEMVGYYTQAVAPATPAGGEHSHSVRDKNCSHYDSFAEVHKTDSHAGSLGPANLAAVTGNLTGPLVPSPAAPRCHQAPARMVDDSKPETAMLNAQERQVQRQDPFPFPETAENSLHWANGTVRSRGAKMDWTYPISFYYRHAGFRESWAAEVGSVQASA